MKSFTKNIFRNLALFALGAVALSACGGAGTCSTCTITPNFDGLTLSIAAPSQYPAGLPTPIEAPLTMTNTSNVNATNLVYTIPAPGAAGNYTGVVIVPNAGVGSASGDCTNIAAGASCTFIATISAYANPGSFTVTATPNATVNGQSIKTTQASKALQSSISVTANLGLVNIPTTSNAYYVLPSDQTIQGSATSPTTAYVSVLVKVAGTGLNSLKLVDETGADLPDVVVLGTPKYTVNSVNNYKVTLPAGKSIQHVQAFSNVCSTLNTGLNNNTACSNEADVNIAQSGVGILSIQPNYFQMSQTRTSQVVTLQNIGTANITNLQLPTFPAPFSLAADNCSTLATLAPLATCTITLNYTLGSNSGQGSYVVNYNNSTSTDNATMTIPYIGSSTTPYAILNASPSSFSLSKGYPVQRIILTNTGTADATSLTPTRPTLLMESSTTTCSSSVAVGASCAYDVYVNYSQSVVAGSGAVVFAYNNGQSNQTTSVAASWSAATSPVPPVPSVPPQLSSEVPADGATGVSTAASVSITFNESMDLTTLVASNFQLQKTSDSSFVTLVSPIYSADSKTVTFATSNGTANPALASASEYKLIIPTPANVKSVSGVGLDLPAGTYPDGVISTFNTATVTQCSGFSADNGWAGILNSGDNSFTKCKWQSDGSLYDCTGGGTPVGLFSTPSVLLPSGGGSLYEANAGSTVLSFNLGSYTSTFDPTSPLTALTAPAKSGTQVTYNIPRGFVFINTTGGLNICGIDTGTFGLTGCAAASPTGLSADAYGAGFSSDGGSNGIFWTANKNSNTISSCPATDDNPTVIAQCNPAGGSLFNQPTAIYATDSYVLVTNAGDNTIVRCDQTNGTLSNCRYTGGNINGPSSIVAGNVSSDTMYITNLTDNSVTFCQNSSGALSQCNRMVYPAGTFTVPSSIFVYNSCDRG